MMQLLNHSLNRKDLFNQQNVVPYPSTPPPASQMMTSRLVGVQMLSVLTWFLDRGSLCN